MRILILTGDSGVGKTTVCAQVAGLAKERGLAVAGILSPSRFEAGQRVGIEVEDVRSGQRRLLARVRQSGGSASNETEGLATERWCFDAQGLAWGIAVLRAATPCDLLIVDELGPLELMRGEGWTEALNVLRTGSYRLAVVVVRPALIGAFKTLDRREPLILSVTLSNRDALPEQILALLESSK